MEPAASEKARELLATLSSDALLASAAGEALMRSPLATPMRAVMGQGISVWIACLSSQPAGRPAPMRQAAEAFCGYALFTPLPVRMGQKTVGGSDERASPGSPILGMCSCGRGAQIRERASVVRSFRCNSLVISRG